MFKCYLVFINVNKILHLVCGTHNIKIFTTGSIQLTYVGEYSILYERNVDPAFQRNTKLQMNNIGFSHMLQRMENC